MKLLAIDTTTEACSAALHIDGNILEKYEVAPRKHAELILPMIDALLAEAAIKLPSLDALAFARGPGAFTGVRISTSVIQGLAYATDLPVVPVSTLAALAQGANADTGTIISAIDARMNEIYWGLFTRGSDNIVTSISQEMLGTPEELIINLDTPCLGVGTGWGKYGKVLSVKVGANLLSFDPECLPRASDVLGLALKEFQAGNVVDAANALPVYLRNKVTG